MNFEEEDEEDAMGRKYKPRLIPEQDRRICGSICMCQLTVVLSCVALVYLTVAIYMPSHRAFKSGIEAVPVMCETVNTTMVETSCDWASCGEWCLTKTSGFCPQIHVTVRRNGTDIELNECSRARSVECPPVNPNSLKKLNCNNGTECGSLHGLFNCSKGHCANMSTQYECHYKADGIRVDSERENAKLTGFFECNHSDCIKIKVPFNCDRYCNRILTAGMNVFIMYEDSLYAAECQSVTAFNRANGTEEGTPLENATEVWRASQDPGGVLVLSCHTVASTEKGSLRATDCLNATIIDESQIPKPSMNFTVFWRLYENSSAVLDPSQQFLPMQTELTIYNSSRLYINLEACVNTLQGECKEFLKSHGRDGHNQTARSRFPCFYDMHNSFFVVAKFDLRKTWRELLIAVVVPSALFTLSCATLCIITRSVSVGDDAKMRCKYCTHDMGDCDSDGDQLTPSEDRHNAAAMAAVTAAAAAAAAGGGVRTH